MLFIKELDTNLFLWLNAHHSPFFDVVMWRISAHETWIPLYLGLIVFLFAKHNWKNALAIVLVCLIAVGLSDFIASGILKNIVCRYRPSHNLFIQEAVHTVKGYRGGLYGFVSSHASNTLATAAVSYYFIRKHWLGIMLLLWSLTVAYSRIYLGVHYPLDICGGFVVGIFSSAIAIYTFEKVKPLVCKTP